MLERGLQSFSFGTCSGYALPKAFNLVGFPYDEVFGSLLGGVEFQQYGIESGLLKQRCSFWVASLVWVSWSNLFGCRNALDTSSV